VSLTIRRGPFGPDRAGRLSFELAQRIVYVEPFPHRVRVDQTVADSDQVALIHESGTAAKNNQQHVGPMTA